jgi:acyl carrier protein
MGPEQIRTKVHQFIRKNFMFDDKQTLGDDQSLLNSGVVDSTGILELISFLEETCQVKFNDSDLVADNFDSVNRISTFITQKLPQAAM